MTEILSEWTLICMSRATRRSQLVTWYHILWIGTKWPMTGECSHWSLWNWFWILTICVHCYFWSVHCVIQHQRMFLAASFLEQASCYCNSSPNIVSSLSSVWQDSLFHFHSIMQSSFSMIFSSDDIAVWLLALFESSAFHHSCSLLDRWREVSPDTALWLLVSLRLSTFHLSLVSYFRCFHNCLLRPDSIRLAANFSRVTALGSISSDLCSYFSKLPIFVIYLLQASDCSILRRPSPLFVAVHISLNLINPFGPLAADYSPLIVYEIVSNWTRPDLVSAWSGWLIAVWHLLWMANCYCSVMISKYIFW